MVNNVVDGGGIVEMCCSKGAKLDNVGGEEVDHLFGCAGEMLNFSAGEGAISEMSIEESNIIICDPSIWR